MDIDDHTTGINQIFNILRLHFSPNIDWEYVEDCLCEDDDGAAQQPSNDALKFWSLPMCAQNSQSQDHQLQALRELSNYIRSTRTCGKENEESYQVALENWANITCISPKEYLAYVYAVTSLAILPQHVVAAAPSQLHENTNIHLALNAVTTYFLSLTIPGAKSFGIFDEGVIEYCLKVFKLLETHTNSRMNNVWIQILSICDDLKLLFRYVHFKDHPKPRDNIIRSILEILYMNYRKGYINSCKYK